MTWLRVGAIRRPMLCSSANFPGHSAPACSIPAVPPCAAKARLASAVQYLPLPAVGGYLSFVGRSEILEQQQQRRRRRQRQPQRAHSHGPTAWARNQPSLHLCPPRLLLHRRGAGPGLRHPAGLPGLLGAAVGPAGGWVGRGLRGWLGWRGARVTQPPELPWRILPELYAVCQGSCPTPFCPCRSRCACCPRWAPPPSSCSPWPAASTRSRCRVRAAAAPCMLSGSEGLGSCRLQRSASRQWSIHPSLQPHVCF